MSDELSTFSRQGPVKGRAGRACAAGRWGDVPRPRFGGPKSLAALPLIDFLDAHPVHVSRIVRCSSFTRSRRAQALRRAASRTRCRSIPFMEIVRPLQGDARNEARDVA